MPSELPSDLRDAMHRLQGKPLYLVDPDTNAAYVLIPASMFHAEESPAADDDDLAETYPAQAAAAFAAGWDEPEMSDYDDYDAHRKRLG